VKSKLVEEMGKIKVLEASGALKGSQEEYEAIIRAYRRAGKL